MHPLLLPILVHTASVHSFIHSCDAYTLDHPYLLPMQYGYYSPAVVSLSDHFLVASPIVCCAMTVIDTINGAFGTTRHINGYIGNTCHINLADDYPLPYNIWRVITLPFISNRLRSHDRASLSYRLYRLLLVLLIIKAGCKPPMHLVVSSVHPNG